MKSKYPRSRTTRDLTIAGDTNSQSRELLEIELSGRHSTACQGPVSSVDPVKAAALQSTGMRGSYSEAAPAIESLRKKISTSTLMPQTSLGPGSVRSPDTPSAPVLDKLAYSIAEAAMLISCGKTTVYLLAQTGKLRISKIARRKSVILAVDLQAYIDRLRQGGRS